MPGGMVERTKPPGWPEEVAARMYASALVLRHSSLAMWRCTVDAGTQRNRS